MANPTADPPRPVKRCTRQEATMDLNFKTLEIDSSLIRGYLLVWFC